MVKCAGCGFLGIWDLTRREWLDADEHFRAHGDDEMGRLHPQLYAAKCFVMEFPLREEWAAEPGAANDTAAVVTVLHRERSCAEWTRWHPGFSPKEHREMLDRRDERDWRARREEDDREWRDKQRREDLEWRSMQDVLARRAKRIEIGLTVFGIAIATGAVITAAYMQVNSQRQTTEMLINASKAAPVPVLTPINE